jgi:hypothetical protein
MRFCASPQFGSCSENFVILTDVSGQTLRREEFSFILVPRARAAAEGGFERGSLDTKFGRLDSAVACQQRG